MHWKITITLSFHRPMASWRAAHGSTEHNKVLKKNWATAVNQDVLKICFKNDSTFATRHDEIPQLPKIKEQYKKTQLLVPSEEIYQLKKLYVPRGYITENTYQLCGCQSSLKSVPTSSAIQLLNTWVRKFQTLFPV